MLSEEANSALPADCVLAIDLIRNCIPEFSFAEWGNTATPGPSRQREFSAGRRLANTLLRRVGISGHTITRHATGAPNWPIGISGSISHKNDVVCALVSTSNLVESIGIDIEHVESLEKAIWSTFASDLEITHGVGLGIQPGVYANMLFSIKESLFKCLHPLLGSNTPSLSEHEIFLNAHNNQYVMEFSYDRFTCHGRLVTRGSHLLTWAFVQNSQ